MGILKSIFRKPRIEPPKNEPHLSNALRAAAEYVVNRPITEDEMRVIDDVFVKSHGSCYQKAMRALMAGLNLQ